MNNQSDLDVRREEAIRAARARPNNGVKVRGNCSATRNALFVGFVIPGEECHRWADSIFPRGHHSRDKPFDPLILSYLNYYFGKRVEVEDPAVPFHVVPNPTGVPDIMYVMDIRGGDWENPLADYNIEEVFDSDVQVHLEGSVVDHTREFLQKDLSKRIRGQGTRGMTNGQRRGAQRRVATRRWDDSGGAAAGVRRRRRKERRRAILRRQNESVVWGMLKTGKVIGICSRSNQCVRRNVVPPKAGAGTKHSPPESDKAHLPALSRTKGKKGARCEIEGADIRKGDIGRVSKKWKVEVGEQASMKLSSEACVPRPLAGLVALPARYGRPRSWWVCGAGEGDRRRRWKKHRRREGPRRGQGVNMALCGAVSAWRLPEVEVSVRQLRGWRRRDPGTAWTEEEDPVETSWQEWGPWSAQRPAAGDVSDNSAWPAQRGAKDVGRRRWREQGRRHTQDMAGVGENREMRAKGQVHAAVTGVGAADASADTERQVQVINELRERRRDGHAGGLCSRSTDRTRSGRRGLRHAREQSGPRSPPTPWRPYESKYAYASYSALCVRKRADLRAASARARLQRSHPQTQAGPDGEAGANGEAGADGEAAVHGRRVPRQMCPMRGLLAKRLWGFWSIYAAGEARLLLLAGAGTATRIEELDGGVTDVAVLDYPNTLLSIAISRTRGMATNQPAPLRADKHVFLHLARAMRRRPCILVIDVCQGARLLANDGGFGERPGVSTEARGRSVTVAIGRAWPDVDDGGVDASTTRVSNRMHKGRRRKVVRGGGLVPGPVQRQELR
ncbi:hypothetical protein GGX14DRAFT_388426 [Mycena pura]|uniref:Uncharacterized protein n=1 Tax=Mycena pura TaxID=153505 RepID=A0AAD6VS31_9AGAR|nr:hypothetical protein GGX14DRAFT_388426 [Mycena pura]